MFILLLKRLDVLICGSALQRDLNFFRSGFAAHCEVVTLSLNYGLFLLRLGLFGGEEIDKIGKES